MRTSIYLCCWLCVCKCNGACTLTDALWWPCATDCQSHDSSTVRHAAAASNETQHSLVQLGQPATSEATDRTNNLRLTDWLTGWLSGRVISRRHQSIISDRNATPMSCGLHTLSIEAARVSTKPASRTLTRMFTPLRRKSTPTRKAKLLRITSNYEPVVKAHRGFGNCP